ncbi:MAG: cysteine synthase A [Oligoflexia bacterium]|nr:cysteine synthase A [Oligoflexia bacterium]
MKKKNFNKPNICTNILELIGNTPLVKIKNKIPVEINPCIKIYAKLEYLNPGFSIKDRIALSMIEDAEKKGILNGEKIIIEATSGNTGIGLAMICASKGYQLILTMPETMSIERRKMLAHLGATIILTPGPLGMTGAVNKAKELLSENSSNYIMLDQFTNNANPEIHRKTTAEEIYSAMDGKVDYFIAGIGTGGTITGVGEILKKYNSQIKVIAIEPAESPVLTGGHAGPHKIQGIGAGFKPSILNIKIVDQIITISSEDAISFAKKLAKEHGILAGISSGAAFAGAIKIAIDISNEIKKNSTNNTDKNTDNNTDLQEISIVTIFPDTCERYLSTDLFKDIN